MVIQVNHLSHMLLLSLLYPSLEAASTQREEARVVFHTSMARMVVGMPKLMKEIMKDKTEGATKTIPSCAFAKAPREWPEEVKMFAKDDVVGTYGLSKACNFVCWAALHEKLLAKGSKVKSLIAHPGTAATETSPRFGKTFDVHRELHGAQKRAQRRRRRVPVADLHRGERRDLRGVLRAQGLGPDARLRVPDQGPARAVVLALGEGRDARRGGVGRHVRGTWRRI